MHSERKLQNIWYRSVLTSKYTLRTRTSHWELANTRYAEDNDQLLMVFAQN